MRSPEQELPLERVDDEELWERYVAGDDGAFSELVKRHASGLYWYLLLSLASPRRAAEYLIKVVELAAAYRQHHEGFDSLKCWLYSIATQTAVPTKQREEFGLAELFEGMKRPEPQKEAHRAAYELADLKRELRQPLLLVTAGGLSVSETARACNFTEDDTVRRIEKALKALKRSEAFTGAGEGT